MSIFFFDVPQTTAIYTLSLHDALPICRSVRVAGPRVDVQLLGARLRRRMLGRPVWQLLRDWREADRKSTRLNSSHVAISYAVFCLKKKKKKCRRSISKTGSVGTTPGSP